VQEMASWLFLRASLRLWGAKWLSRQDEFFPRCTVNTRKEFGVSSKEFRDKRNYEIFDHILYFRCFRKFCFQT